MRALSLLAVVGYGCLFQVMPALAQTIPQIVLAQNFQDQPYRNNGDQSSTDQSGVPPTNYQFPSNKLQMQYQGNVVDPAGTPHY